MCITKMNFYVVRVIQWLKMGMLLDFFFQTHPAPAIMYFLKAIAF